MQYFFHNARKRFLKGIADLISVAPVFASCCLGGVTGADGAKAAADFLERRLDT
jgi:hypothetical protein